MKAIISDTPTVLGHSIICQSGADEQATSEPAMYRYDYDKRSTMPKGRYVFGASDSSLRPSVPKGC